MLFLADQVIDHHARILPRNTNKCDPAACQELEERQKEKVKRQK
jgi:hypothetical protein